MPRLVFVSQFLLPLESVKLGRFITNIDHPHQDYHDPACVDPPRTTVQTRNQYDSFAQETSSSTFSGALTSFLGTGFSKRLGSKVRVSTERVQTYSLENSSLWFESATKLQETRQWLERAIDQGDDVFLIVGYHTISDARIAVQSTAAQQRGATAGLPVALAVAPSMITAPVTDLAKSEGTLKREAGSDIEEQFIAPGEQVCALQYRRVRYRFLSSKKIDNASLAKSPRWAVLDRMRDENEGEDDVIEVEAEDDVEDLDGEWVREKATGDETLIMRG